MTTPPSDNRVTRRYRNNQEYTRDAQSMLTHGWRVTSLRRNPDNTIAATYTYVAPVAEPSTGPATQEPTPATAAPTVPLATPASSVAGIASTSASVTGIGASSSGMAGGQLYRGGAKALLALWGVLALTGWFLFLGVGIAPVYTQHYFLTMLLVLLAEYAALLIWDWPNAVTLFGALDWRSMPWWERVVGGLFFAAFPTLYLILATVYHFRAVGLTPRQYLGQTRSRFRVSTGWVKAGILVGSLALVIAFCSSSTMVMALAPALPVNASVTHLQANHSSAQVIAPPKTAPTATVAASTPLPVVTVAPTATLAPPTPTVVVATPTPRPVPTATPRPQPTATPRPPAPTATPRPPAPTATPQPTCDYGGAPPNPWCYTFNYTGKYIYSPPSNFCNYFNCIASFWTHTNGYVDECQDGTYSHSGGVSGACSYHGGELRPLYQP